MQRLKAVTVDEATGKTKEIFNTIQAKFGGVSNMMKTMGSTPALLDAYINFYTSLSAGSLGPKTSTLIALALSQSNGCDYCLAAHQFVGIKVANLDLDTIAAARNGRSSDAKTEAILKFALILVNMKGNANDADVTVLKNAGVTENEIGEIVGYVGLNILSNYFNKVANTELDAFLK